MWLSNSRVLPVLVIFIFATSSEDFVSNQASSSYTSDALSDQVTFLPGASSPLVSNQFSGYLDISESKALHYMYFESERNPATDSVIFWTNGGPGCSGLLGLYTEFGPWRSGPNLTLIRNPFTWVKYANIVFLEQPVGVGFSYSTETISHTGYNDFEASRDNLLAIKAFFRKYPERAQNAFYLASESYGGHYIPQWTLQVLGDRDTRKHFKGYLLGNPYTSYGAGSTAMASTLWGLQLVPKPLWDAFTALQCESLFSSAYDFMRQQPDCFDILDALESYIERLNPYALEFPICVVPESPDNANNSTAPYRAGGKHTSHTTTLDATTPTIASPDLVSAQAKVLLRLAKRVRDQRRATTSTTTPPNTNVDTSNTHTTQTRAHHKLLAESDIGGVHTLNTLQQKTNHYSQYRYQTHADSSAHRPRTSTTHTSGSRFFNEHSLLSQESEFMYDPCAQNYLVEYMNDAAVQEALHVSAIPPTPTHIPTTAPVQTPTTTTSPTTTSTATQHSTTAATSTTRRWDFCSDEVNQNWAFNDYLADTTSLYRLIYTHKHKPKGFKMLIYSGDIDGVCATIGTQHWIYNVTHSAPLTLYRPWTYTDSQYGEQMGGYLTQFADSFSFLTVRYAGHEVPAYQPQKALHMFNKFLDGSLFVQ